MFVIELIYKAPLAGSDWCYRMACTDGPGDKLHPNRAGYAAMGRVIDPKVIAGPVNRP